MATCPVCGFDPPSLSPPDAVVALRSLPRRFGEAARSAAGADPGAAAARATAVAAHAATAAAAIAAAGEQLRLVLIDDTPDLPPVVGAPDAALATGQLAAASSAVADLAAAQPATAWSRTGRRDGVEVTAVDLLRDAVHAGVHELRLAEGRAQDGA